MPNHRKRRTTRPSLALLPALCLAPVLFLGGGCTHDDRTAAASPVTDRWRQLPTKTVGGVLGERLRIWRDHRLWSNIEDPYLLAGFESRPGTHPWQGEHVSKWLHAATLAHQATGDPKLLTRLEETVGRLIATQQDDGYLGTYSPEERFSANWKPDTVKRNWDVWTHRYVLYAFLTYEKYHPDPNVVDACVKIGDLLIDTFGSGGRDITEIGTKDGISSMTLLESILMLYERTGQERFLRFAEHIVASSEANRKLRLLSAMLAGEDVSGPGLGKAYQLMANLLGYGELFRQTGDNRYLAAVRNGWRNIQAEHTFQTGGPWGYNSREGQNVECFSPAEYLHPSNLVETCSTTTWIQLSLQLLRITGDAKYGSEAERALLNHLLGAQAPDGIQWAYFTQPNSERRDYEPKIHCCASSGPRALEMYARHLAGEADGALSINSYLPFEVELDSSVVPVRGLSIKGRYPFEEEASIELDLAQADEFAVDFRLPSGTKSLTVTVEGETQTLRRLPSGFLRLQRVWRPREAIHVEFEFELEAHFTTDRDGDKWVTFNRGPLVLAEDVLPGAQTDFRLEAPSGPPNPNAWLQPTSQSSGGPPSYRLQGSKTILIPYYLAGSTGNGVRTMFPVH